MSDAARKTVITAFPETLATYFRRIWKYRYLVWVFAQRDIRVKYSQTLLGVSWTLLQPLTSILVFSFFFGYLLKWQTGTLPFPVYVISGLLGWNFFSYIVHAGSASIQESSHIIKKIYFPKSILPLSKVLIALTELLLGLLIFIPMLLYYGQSVSWKIIFFPLVLLFNALCALTLVFGVAAFSYRRRDLFHVLPFMVYFGIWVTPVFFTEELIPHKLRFLLDLNPMASVTGMWRWVLFDGQTFRMHWIPAFLSTAVLCICAMYFYNRNENKFSDFS